METHVLSIRGMHCASCVQRVTSALEASSGVSSASVDLLSQQAHLQTTEDFDPHAAITAVESVGYKAVSHDSTASTAIGSNGALEVDDATSWSLRVLAGMAMLGIMLRHFIWGGATHGDEPVLRVVWLALAIYVGWPYFAGALRALFHGQATMDTLIALGAGAALFAGNLPGMNADHAMHWMDGGLILIFVTVGKWLEAKSRSQAEHAARGLANLASPVAVVQRNEQWIEVAPTGVAPGETVLVRPGAIVPLDGRVEEGNSDVDESWLTGESLLVMKTLGASVLAGTINRGVGALTVLVTHGSNETLLARVDALLQTARASKMKVQRLADRIVARFVPAVLVIAVATLLGWGWLAGNWPRGIQALVAVLVMACPCVLGLATPVAVAIAMGVAGRNGILIKQAQALETAAGIDTVIFDKTGTLTVGRPELNAVLTMPGVSESSLLAIAAAVEQLSPHPLAKSVVAAALARQIPVPRAEGFAVLPGLGIQGTVSGSRISIGAASLIQQLGIETPEEQLPAVAKVSLDGNLLMWVAQDSRLLGALAFADRVLPDSKTAIVELQNMGVKCELVSGDQETVARRVADDLGIRDVIARALPQDKLAHVQSLRSSGRTVMMVGDGINDAPSLAAATLGVAMGAGADIARESAQIVVLGSNPTAVGKLIRLARCTVRIIEWNFYWALGFNLVMIPAAAGVFENQLAFSVSPIFAALLMSISSIAVVANSWRIRFALPAPASLAQGQE